MDPRDATEIVQRQARLLVEATEGRGFVEGHGTLRVHLKGLRELARMEIPIGGRRAKPGRLALVVSLESRVVSIMTHEDLERVSVSCTKHLALYANGDRLMFKIYGVKHEISHLWGCWVPLILSAMKSGTQFCLYAMTIDESGHRVACQQIGDALGIVASCLITPRAAIAIGNIRGEILDYSVLFGQGPGSMMHFSPTVGSMCSIAPGAYGGVPNGSDSNIKVLADIVGPLLTHHTGINTMRDHCKWLIEQLPLGMNSLHTLNPDVVGPAVGLAALSRLWVSGRCNATVCADANILMAAMPGRIYAPGLLVSVATHGLTGIHWCAALKSRFISLHLEWTKNGSVMVMELPLPDDIPARLLYELATSVEVTDEFTADRRSRALVLLPSNVAVSRVNLVGVLYAMSVDGMSLGQIVGPGLFHDTGAFGLLEDVVMGPELAGAPHLWATVSAKNFFPTIVVLAACIMLALDVSYNDNSTFFTAAAFFNTSLPVAAIQLQYQILHLAYGACAIVALHDDKNTRTGVNILLSSVVAIEVLAPDWWKTCAYAILVLWAMIPVWTMVLLVKDKIKLEVEGSRSLIESVDNVGFSGFRCTDTKNFGLSWIRGSSDFDPQTVGLIGHTSVGATSLRGPWIPCGGK